MSSEKWRARTPTEKPMSVRGVDVSKIFSENVTAKILQVALRKVTQEEPPFRRYPHTVPQSGKGTGKYEEREADFWTCGFFPGCIFALLERRVKYPESITLPGPYSSGFPSCLLELGNHWSVAIDRMSKRTDTHDMGFIVQPAIQKMWELSNRESELDTVVNAAYALASRYDGRVKAIRSWDVAINDRYSITDMDQNFLVIIDSMCNLDLLYFVGHNKKDQELINIATQHADSIINEILRPDFSSYHLVNFDPKTGVPKAKMTNQGYKDNSTWSRGQAWAIMGFAQTFMWTRDIKYLQTAIKCAEYFTQCLETGKGQYSHHMVPLWDFDAPKEDLFCSCGPMRDVSAGIIAANGLLIIHGALQGLSPAENENIRSTADMLDVALSIVAQTLEMSYDGDLAAFAAPATDGEVFESSQIRLKESSFDAILRNSTSNWNEHAHMKYADHGLVYADYYLLEFGNKLLRAGLVDIEMKTEGEGM